MRAPPLQLVAACAPFRSSAILLPPFTGLLSAGDGLVGVRGVSQELCPWARAGGRQHSVCSGQPHSCWWLQWRPCYQELKPTGASLQVTTVPCW